MLPVCLLLLQAASPPDVEALVRKTGEFYFALESYSVRIRQDLITIGETRPERRFRLDKGAQGELRLEFLQPARFLQTTDGTHAWQYNDAKGEYRQEEHGGPVTRALAESSRGLVQRFEKLAALAGDARFLRWDNLKSGQTRVRCAVVEVKSPADAQSGWVDKLCIQPDSTLVLRSELRWTGVPSRSTGLGDASTPSSRSGTFAPGFGRAGQADAAQVTHYDWLAVGSVAHGVSFRFDPPPGARRID